LIEFYLTELGLDVTVATNGQEARDRALEADKKGRPFHLILMDMQMPVLDGYEATQQLRAAGYRKPIVALTAHAMDAEREKCLAIGCDDFASKPIDQEAFRKFCHARMGIDLDQHYRRVRTRDNNYLQDRQKMKLGDHTGIPGIPNQDMAMWETMGPIADRTQERLGASDVAIVQFRRMMLEAVGRFENGHEPPGLAEPHIPHAKLRSFEGIVPKTVNWRTLGASEEELASYPTEVLRDGSVLEPKAGKVEA